MKIYQQSQSLHLAKFLIIFLCQTGSITLLYARENEDTIHVVKEITGIVKDVQGNSIAGVNVIVKGTTIATRTNKQGVYHIQVPDDKNILLFSFINHTMQEIDIQSKNQINITLEKQQEEGYSTVVIGYGRQEKATLTGAVASIQGEELMKRPVVQNSLALQGLVTGVTVAQENGGHQGKDAGIITIRGIGSFGAEGKNTPLVLIDGVPTEWNEINMADIASVSILKDAAAASIYGSRGANGVILITTKRGEKGVFSVNYHGYIGQQTPTELPKFVDSQTFMRYLNTAQVNEGNSPLYTDEQIAGVPSEEFQDTDILEDVFKDATVQQYHSISVNGGTNYFSARGSFSFLDQPGTYTGNAYQRYTFRLNTDINPSKKLHLGIDVSLRQSNYKEPLVNSEEGALSNTKQLYRQLYRFNPILALQLDDGRWGVGLANNPQNPLAWAVDGGGWKEQWQQLILNFNADYEILEGLSFNINFAPKFNLNQVNSFKKQIDYYDNLGNYVRTSPSQNALYREEGRTTTLYFKTMLTYEKSLGNHRFKVLTGYDLFDFTFNSINASRSNFPLDNLPELSVGSLDTQANGSSGTEWALMSFFGRLNYDFQSKYLFEVNLRYDGSSRFSKGNRWGVFPSFSAGWRVSQEEFMQPVRFISDMKLRVSWGQLGNQQIGDYPYQSTVSLGTVNYTVGDSPVVGATPTELANTNITWENTKMLDFGIDLGFLQNKLSVSFDYYIKNTRDILLQLPVPDIVGLTAPFQNVAEIQNTGWELGIGYQDQIRNFKYGANFLLSDVINEVKNMNGVEQISRIGERQDLFLITREGSPVNSIYGYEAEGLFQSQEEVDKHATQFGTVAPGDIKYKDQNEDGIIDNEDLVTIGDIIPRYTFAFNLFAEYKGIDLTLFFQGVGKRDGLLFSNEIIALQNGSTVQEWQLDYWTEDNTNAVYPRPWTDISSNNNKVSSFWTRDAAYIRLKTLQIGYTFPQKWVEKVSLANLRIYLSGQNLWTHDNFLPGYDPELRVGNGHRMPSMKVYVLGLHLKL